jgi:hypothetical protein
MPHFYVNKEAQPNGDHEVHQYGCAFIPGAENRLYLGVFGSCHQAVGAARRYYMQSNGCFRCAPECHTS